MVLGGVLCHVVSEWMLFRKWRDGSCGSGAVGGPFLNLRSKALLWPFFSLRKERSWFTRVWELVNNPQCFVSIAVSEDQKRSHLIFMSPFQRVFNSKILSETNWHFHKLGFFCYFMEGSSFIPAFWEEAKQTCPIHSLAICSSLVGALWVIYFRGLLG